MNKTNTSLTNNGKTTTNVEDVLEFGTEIE